MSYPDQIQGSLYVYVGTSMVTSFLRTDISVLHILTNAILMVTKWMNKKMMLYKNGIKIESRCTNYYAITSQLFVGWSNNWFHCTGWEEPCSAIV